PSSTKPKRQESVQQLKASQSTRAPATVMPNATAANGGSVIDIGLGSGPAAVVLCSIVAVSGLRGWLRVRQNPAPGLGSVPASNLEFGGDSQKRRKCIEFALKAKPVRRYIPQRRLQYKIWWFVTSTPFDLKGQPESYSSALDYMNMKCCSHAIFTIEFLFELFGFSFRAGKATISINFFRLFRAMRLVKLAEQGRASQDSAVDFYQIALPYVALLILMLFFIYAVIGMQMFGKIRLDSNTHINRTTTSGRSSPLLWCCFASATRGEAWQEILLACVNATLRQLNRGADHLLEPDEIEDGCGSPIAYPPFFISFYMLCSFLVSPQPGESHAPNPPLLPADTKCDRASDAYVDWLAHNRTQEEPVCQQLIGYPYFISFYVICSFL
uniref:Ion_trans domain-containing protein n=1 Tax=Macrostomum lignano TaxID=282301 RepID=A0A1I8FGX9_9PLAT